MRKIDLHLHTRLSTEDKSVKVKNLFSSAPEMIAHMNYLGIEKAVLMSGGESNDFFGTSDEMCKICQTYPTRFAWMCNLDEKDIDTIHTRLEKYKQNGAIGIGELIINKKLDHPFLKVLFTAAEKLELPITIHMSPRENYNYGVVDEQYVSGKISRDVYEKLYYKNAERIFHL